LSAAAEVIEVTIGPQPGPQTAFFESEADICIYGGAAGSGKTYALVVEPLRNYNNSRFAGVIFRRTSVQVRNPGGLWDETALIYPQLGAVPRNAALEWRFPAGWKLKFAHLEHDTTVHDWQGSQIPFIGFDELTHFSEAQFFYMLSRNRSASGVRGYIRATCNPDADSWVRRLIDWWIGDDGYPIKERSGVVRWFIRQNDALIWGESKEEIEERYGKDAMPKSLTFIPAQIYDNKILMEKDPSYLASLKALTRVERARLLDGNWNVRASAGDYFRREWFPVVSAIPDGWVQAIRSWDRAASRVSAENPDPDWTVGVLLYRYPNNTWIIGDVKSIRESPGKVQQFIKEVAKFDGRRVRIVAMQDPGSAGVEERDNFVRMLAGYNVETYSSSKDKENRAKPVSAQCEYGNVGVMKGSWNERFFIEVGNFPLGSHDDQVDALSGAFNDLAENSMSTLQVLGR
jgi:predicted phage terminase large subunit-like protein